MEQTTGIPMGGKISAQIASLTLNCLERQRFLLRNSLALLLGLTWARYRDNIYVVGPGSAITQHLTHLTKTFQWVYQMPVKLEQVGSDLSVLECHLKLTPCPPEMSPCSFLPQIYWHGKLLPPSLGGLCQWHRWVSPSSHNFSTTIKSLIPSALHKCALWSWTMEAFLTNVSNLMCILVKKEYPNKAWHLLDQWLRKRNPKLAITKEIRESATKAWRLFLTTGEKEPPKAEWWGPAACTLPHPTPH